MAEIVVSAVINKTVDIAGNLAVEEGTRLYWLSEDINWIQGEMRQIQAYLKDVDSKQEQVGLSQGMTTLIQKIRDIAYDAEDVLDTFLPRMASYDNRSAAGILSYYFGRTSFIVCYCFTAHKLSMEIAKIRKRIEDIDRPKATYDITAGSFERLAWDSRRPRLYADEPAITGFDTDIERLTHKLLDSEIKFGVISIVGMGGLGKTTLAVKLFKSTKQQFQCSALVYVSQQPNIREILYDIGWQVGLQKKQLEEEKELEANLMEFLREKRYVIVFDDVWDTKTWDSLKTNIPMNSSDGSRVIVTSRESDVGRYIGGESSLHELQPLDPRSGWQLFCKMVKEPLENMNETACLPSELEYIGRKIVERCGGVPLAIVVTAGLLRERERRKDRWNEVLKSMGSHQDDAIRNTLALSYKDLLIELKPCFLYFGLFPEDYRVFAFKLINMWVAEKFINVVGSQTLEEVGEAYLNNLTARNLIQVASREADGRIRSCRIHDLLRTLCNSMAKENDFYDTCDNLTSISAARVRRLTTLGRGGISEWAHQTRKLRSFLFFEEGNDCISMKQVKNLCKTSRFLRVLSVGIVGGIRNRVSLPNEIGNLIHLSYLEIWVMGRTEYLIFPNTISNLKSLLTLEVRGRIEIICLPACLWRMKQLRHILIPDAEIKDLDEVWLPNLQTLKVYNGVYLLKAKGFGESTSLRLLDIGCCSENNLETPTSNKPEDLSLEFDLSNCQNLFDMCLRNKLGKLAETNKFPPNLTFIMTKLEEDPMKTLGKLSNLKILLFGRHSYEGTMMVCSRDDFPQLQVLELSSLRNLEELNVEEGGVPRLHKLIVRFCSRIQKLPYRLRNMTFDGESMINETESSRRRDFKDFIEFVDRKEEEIKQKLKGKFVSSPWSPMKTESSGRSDRSKAFLEFVDGKEEEGERASKS